MKKFGAFVMIILLSTILFCCLVAVALIINNVKAVADLSGWAQALGGMAAIIAAFVIGESQSRSTIEALNVGEALAYKAKSRALLAVANEIVNVATEANKCFTEGNLLWVQIAHGQYSRPLQTLIDELSGIHAHEFGSQPVLMEVVSLKVSASYLKAMLDRIPEAVKLWEGADNNRNLFDHLRDVITINTGVLMKASEQLNELLDASTLTSK